MKKCILQILLLLICISLHQTILAADYIITTYGAVGNGIFLNTEPIQIAIDKAHKDGGGRVIIPEGIFLTGSIDLKSGVELHLAKDAVLMGSTNPEHHRRPEGTYMRGIILGSQQSDISISGHGTIDGQGLATALHVDSLYHAGHEEIRYNYVEKRPRFYMRPMLIVFVQCQSVDIKQVTLKNSSSWVQHYDRCRGLTIDSMSVYSDAYWNNDGIDISDCQNVSLTNSFFNCADDGICLKSHFTEHIMDSVYIANCTVRSSASAVKFGTKSLGGFRNVIIKNIKVYDTFRSAIAIESVDGGILENILVDGITATNTGNAIFIRLGDREEQYETGTLKNVTLRNIKVDIAFERPDYAYEMRGPNLPFFHNIFPSSITGIPGHKIENLLLENIVINFPGRANKAMAYAPLSRLDSIPEMIAAYPEYSMFGELPAWGFYVRHVEDITFKNVKINLEQADYRNAFVFDKVENLKLEKVEVSGDAKEEKVILKDCNNCQVDPSHKAIKL